MKKINIAITGGLGKMGQKIINSSKKDKKFKITSITESKVLNKKVSFFGYSAKRGVHTYGLD